MKIAVLLHNIRSAHNVGSIFRTADAAGVSEIYLSGYTPHPVDRFNRPHKEIAKVALGAEQVVPWKPLSGVGRFLREARKSWWVVGVEQDARSIDHRSCKADTPTLFVFGNEVRGLSRAMRALCETIVEIPMRGSKESLNVSVAAGVILFGCIPSECGNRNRRRVLAAPPEGRMNTRRPRNRE